MVFIHFQLGEEEPRPWSSCDDVHSFKLRAKASKVLGGMVVADSAKVSRAMNLTMPVVSTVAASHSGVVNSVAVIKCLLRRSTRVGGGRWT
jgi:hypothetical protein